MLADTIGATPDIPTPAKYIILLTMKAQQFTSHSQPNHATLPQAYRVAPANPDILAACPDITRLSHLNAPCLAHNLEARARLGDIHTAAGSEVLVVVNPCRWAGGCLGCCVTLLVAGLVCWYL